MARLEIRYLPPASGSRPRTIRLKVAAYRALLVAVGAYAAFLVVGLVLLVFAVRDLESGRATADWSVTRQRIEQRQVSLVARFDRVEADAALLGTRLEKAALAYGLDVERTPPTTGGATSSGDRLKSTAPVRERVHAVQEAAVNRVAGVRRLLDEIARFEESQPEAAAVTPSMSPLRGSDFVMTRSMGFARNPFTEQREYHAGIDLTAPLGSPIFAPADGLVVFAGRYPVSRRSAWWQLGNLVAIRSGDRYVTLFGHCDDIEVKRGATVKRGERVATVGESGWSPNPLLHYGVWREVDGSFEPLDPRLFMLNRRWTDDAEILAGAHEPLPPSGWDRLPRALRGR